MPQLKDGRWLLLQMPNKGRTKVELMFLYKTKIFLQWNVIAATFTSIQCLTQKRILNNELGKSHLKSVYRG